MRSFLSVLGMIVFLSIVPVVGATTISGTGTWGNTAPTTTLSAPGDSWSFSLDIPNPISGNPTFQATEFVYDLNGSQVTSALLGEVQFYTVTSGGLFDLYTSDGILSLYGADVQGSGLILLPGVYSAEIALSDATQAGTGTVTLTGAAVPEPNTLTLFAIGLMGLFAFGYMRSRTAARVS